MNAKRHHRTAVAALLAAFFLAAPARGATVTQNFTLDPGWNAVFLEVEPPDRNPDLVFAGVGNLLSVWTWNRNSSPVQYIQNPGLLLPEDPYMLAYFPGQPSITNLNAIAGERAYLVQIGPGPSQPWSVTGEPAIPRVTWKPNSFNLVGFHLDPVQGPLFDDFFAPSPAHAGQEIYALDNPTGTWVAVTGPSARMVRGEAYWVYCRGASAYAGPLSVQVGSSAGLDFGSKLTEQEIVVKNASAAQHDVTFQVSSGDARLHAWVSDPDNIAGRWVDIFLATVAPMAFPAGHEQRIRLGVVREGMTAGADYSSNLEIDDGAGMLLVLPATVTGVPVAGLWVGDVTADRVKYNASGLGEKTPVGSPFGFRLILHVDGGGQARLLREVVQLWQAGTWKPDPEHVGHMIVDQPGTFVLVANRARLDDFRGAALRDGQEVGRRISTAVFGFDAPVAATSGAFALGSALQFDVNMNNDDLRNPFLHQYNKDHTAADSYNIARTITLDFGDHDVDGNLVTGVPQLSWGSTLVGGVYSETLSLQLPAGDATPYTVEIGGTFRLRRVSDVAQLEL